MLFRKKVKIRIAYCLLAATAAGIVIHDAEGRSAQQFHLSLAQRAQFRAAPVPLPILPIAQSPFSEARPDAVPATNTVLAAATPAPAPEQHTAAPGVYFLNAAMQADTGDGPVTFNRGTRVRLVREQDGKLLVRHKKADFLVEKTQVTGDIASLTALAKNSR